MPALRVWQALALCSSDGRSSASGVPSGQAAGSKALCARAPDLPQVAFSRLRQEWLDLGYDVPPEATEGIHGLGE